MCGAGAKPRQAGANQQPPGSSCADLEDKAAAELPRDHSGVGQGAPPHNAAVRSIALRTQAPQRQMLVIAASKSTMWS
jgi:hypothetical protein